MTNQEKAERCGEFVRDELETLTVFPRFTTRQCSCPQCDAVRSAVVDGARQAGHWGRLALMEVDRKQWRPDGILAGIVRGLR